MRGNSKHGYHRHRSNKHYKKQIVRVLLDSGSDSDGDLVFVSKDKPMLLPYSKRLVPQSWNTFSKHWRGYNETNDQSNTNGVHLNQVFVNRSEDDEIYPLTVSEIAEAQKVDAEFKHYFKRNAVFDKGLEIKLVENTIRVADIESKEVRMNK